MNFVTLQDFKSLTYVKMTKVRQNFCFFLFLAKITADSGVFSDACVVGRLGGLYLGCPFPRNRTKPDETERILSSNVLQKCTIEQYKYSFIYALYLLITAHN